MIVQQLSDNDTAISWNHPPPRISSHHQDYSFFRLGNPYKPSNLSLASWVGGRPKYYPTFPRIQSPCQRMIGVYNHLRNAKYLGSITILRRWARIPRDSPDMFHCHGGTWVYLVPPRQADLPRPSPNLPSGKGTECFFLQRGVRLRRRFLWVERWKGFQWKVTLPKFSIETLPISKGEQSSNQPFSDACFLEHDFSWTITFTLPETNIAPENRSSQKETNIPTIHFQGLC